MLYMLQAIPLPIVRSLKLYTQHWVFVELDKHLMLCIQYRAPDDLRRNHLKHVQHL